jgi:hypothetical protein
LLALQESPKARWRLVEDLDKIFRHTTYVNETRQLHTYQSK